MFNVQASGLAIVCSRKLQRLSGLLCVPHLVLVSPIIHPLNPISQAVRPRRTPTDEHILCCSAATLPGISGLSRTLQAEQRSRPVADFCFFRNSVILHMNHNLSLTRLIGFPMIRSWTTRTQCEEIRIRCTCLGSRCDA